jgi:hypothetical protein
MKHLLPALAALSMVGCAHAGPPVDLSPPQEALAPPQRPTIHHLRHYPTPPHPVARPAEHRPHWTVREVPVHPLPPQEPPLAAEWPPAKVRPLSNFDQRWLGSPPIRDVAPGVTGAPQVVAPSVSSNVDANRLSVALKLLAAVLGMGVVAAFVGHRRNGH